MKSVSERLKTKLSTDGELSLAAVARTCKLNPRQARAKLRRSKETAPRHIATVPVALRVARAMGASV